MKKFKFAIEYRPYKDSYYVHGVYDGYVCPSGIAKFFKCEMKDLEKSLYITVSSKPLTDGWKGRINYDGDLCVGRFKKYLTYGLRKFLGDKGVLTDVPFYFKVEVDA